MAPRRRRAALGAPARALRGEADLMDGEDGRDARRRNQVRHLDELVLRQVNGAAREPLRDGRAQPGSA